MSEELKTDDLEMAKTPEEKSKKFQTPEQKTVVEAGVEKLKEVGVSENLLKVLPLVAVWKDEDAEALAAAKDAVIESFGGIDAFKDYVTNELAEELEAFVGITKCVPIMNNIKSFYARRPGTKGRKKKVKLIQVKIGATIYNVNAEYRDSLNELPTDEKKELILSHPDTAEVVTEELL